MVGIGSSSRTTWNVEFSCTFELAPVKYCWSLKFRFEYFNAKIYFPSTHWKSSCYQDCESATFCVTMSDIFFLLAYELEYMEASYKYDD